MFWAVAEDVWGKGFGEHKTVKWKVCVFVFAKAAWASLRQVLETTMDRREAMTSLEFS